MAKKGFKMSDEHKRKIGEANKKSHLGLSWGKHTDEYKKKMSEFKRNHKVTEETKLKHRAKKHTQQSKEKMSKSHLGKKLSKQHIENLSKALRGRKHTTETIEKIAAAKRGEKSHFWKGGRVTLQMRIRNNFIYRLWRDDVFKRDDWTCQDCGVRGGKLNADHIIPFTKLLDIYQIKTFEQAIECKEIWNINNGKTLCIPCHIKTPTYARNLKHYSKIQI